MQQTVEVYQIKQDKNELCSPSAVLRAQYSEPACHFIKSLVALVFGVSVHELNAQTRLGAKIAFARQLAMYIAHVRLGMKLVDIGYLFGRDRTTVAHACRLVEDRRDEPRIDFMIDCIERAVEEWLELSTQGVQPQHLGS